MNRYLSNSMAVALLALSPSVFAESLDDLVQQALASNLALSAQEDQVQAQLSALDEARNRFFPSLTLNARYTRAEGGRVLDFPVGDLLNPVYSTLNALTAAQGRPASFPQIANQQTKLLRPREQDTRVTLQAPLYVPALDAQLEARKALLQLAANGREVAARQLVKDVKNAYWALLQTRAQREVLAQSEKVLLENQRIAQVLLDNGKATRDRVLRAQSEVLAVKNQLAEVDNAQRQSQRYLNLLRNAPLEQSIETDPQQGLDGSNQALDSPSATAVARPELRQAQSQLDALKANEKAVNASYRPTVLLSADAGYQAPTYRFNEPNSGLATASLVLSWTLADFGVRDAQRGKIRAEQKQAEKNLAQLRQQLELSVRSASDNLNTALEKIQVSKAAADAALEAFRIATRKRDAGVLTQVEFFDAERAYTEARQKQIIAQYQYQTSRAEWEFATASFPLQPYGRIAANP